jgi:ribosomal protein S18 acetylase RimI-like enzyme
MPYAKKTAVTTRTGSHPGHGVCDRGRAVRVARKLELWKRSGLFGEDTKGATIRRACTAEELSQAYRLVHEVYIGTGYLTTEPAGLRLRMFETSSETATFIAEKDGVVVGVLSVVPNTWDLGLPADGAFAAELNRARATGRILCELTNQAVAEEFRKSAVPTELMRCAIAHAIQAGYQDTIATVSPSHHGFYESVGFARLGSERSYSAKLHDPVIALRLDLDRYRASPAGLDEAGRFLHHFAAAGNPFQFQVSAWTKRARHCFLNMELLERLFVRDRNFVAECGVADRCILQRRWGLEMFEAVTGLTEASLLAGKTEDNQPANTEAGGVKEMEFSFA